MPHYGNVGILSAEVSCHNNAAKATNHSAASVPLQPITARHGEEAILVRSFYNVSGTRR